MEHELRVLPDADAVAAGAAELIAQRARRAVDERGAFTIAVSGGRTPWRMLALLRGLPDVPWPATRVFQVDERIAPSGDPVRNLTQLRDVLAGQPVTIVPMPVEDTDLAAAADRYAATLPELDLIHLGLGADGHTASLVPGDPVLAVSDRLVALTDQPYQGRLRMTLTYPALAGARELLWVVTGADKADALAALLAGSPDIPAGRVQAERSLILADAAASGAR